MSLFDNMFPGWSPDAVAQNVGELVKRSKTWFFVQRRADNTFMYECEQHSPKVREGRGELRAGTRAVVYQKGVAVCEYSAHTPALNGLKRRKRGALGVHPDDAARANAEAHAQKVMRGRSGWEMQIAARLLDVVPQRDPVISAYLTLDTFKKKNPDLWKMFREDMTAPSVVADVVIQEMIKGLQGRR